MKFKNIKKITALLAVSTLALSGCQSEDKTSQNNSITIGIVQLAEHPALDAVRNGFEEGLKESNVDAKIDFQNAQGDLSNTNTIAKKFVTDKDDLIFAIATPAAQAAKNATQKTPIVFSAVTDPVSSGLVKSIENPGENVTGTSDKTPIKEQLSLFKEIDPKIKKVGIVFNTSEANSKSQVDEAKREAKSLGLEIVDIGVNNINEVAQAVDSALSKSDAMYIITDNTVASAITAVTSKEIDAGKIVIGSEEAHVKGGALMTVGLSYFELGKESGRMAAQIIKDGKKPSEIPVGFQDKFEKTLNKETLSKLKLDKNLKIFDGAKEI